jgi:hypothetical protein
MLNKTSRILLDQDYDLLSFQDKCKFVDYSPIGSIWYNRKSGIAAKIVGRSWRGVHLSRDNGKVTVIQNHYFANDYCPVA